MNSRRLRPRYVAAVGSLLLLRLVPGNDPCRSARRRLSGGLPEPSLRGTAQV